MTGNFLSSFTKTTTLAVNVAQKLKKLNTKLHPRPTPRVQHNSEIDCGQIHHVYFRHHILVPDGETVNWITMETESLHPSLESQHQIHVNLNLKNRDKSQNSHVSRGEPCQKKSAHMYNWKQTTGLCSTRAVTAIFIITPCSFFCQN